MAGINQPQTLRIRNELVAMRGFPGKIHLPGSSREPRWGTVRWGTVDTFRLVLYYACIALPRRAPSLT